MPNPDSDPDRDTEPERTTDPRYDNWPIQRYETYTQQSVERETPRDEGGTLDEVADEYREQGATGDVEWIGFAGGSGTGTPYLLGDDGAIYEGEIDEANDRVVLRDASRRDVDHKESLGEHIEEIGEEHDWQWLSSFAREHLEDDEQADELTGPALEVRDVEFQQRNLTASSDVDVGFSGSYTLADESGQVYIIDRAFDVTEAGSDRVSVEVDEDYLVAESPESHRSAGDADIVEERQHGFDLDADTDARNWENEVAADLQEWHETHVGWPARDRDRDAEVR